MILQALKEYYDRKAELTDDGLPVDGFENKRIPFFIVIDHQGNFKHLEDTRESDNDRSVGREFLVPRSEGRSGSKSYETTFLLWDHIGYVLGVSRDGESDSKNRATRQHKTWMKMINELPDKLKETPGVSSIIKFYEKDGISRVIEAEDFQECLKIPGCIITFKLIDELLPVPSSDYVKEYVISKRKNNNNKLDGGFGVCLVTGETGEIAITHGSTRINKDAKSLVSFQKNSGYDSYGKVQGYNAPISKSTEFAYVTALNDLLKRRIVVGDCHFVFWGNRENKLEENISKLFEDVPADDPQSGIYPVRELLNSIYTGAFSGDDDYTMFYVLGLSPNSARISVRVWEPVKITVFSDRIRQYFEDFALQSAPYQPDYYSLNKILKYISPLDDSERIPPSVSGDFVRAIIRGNPYPSVLLQLAVNRIRSDKEHRVSRIRAAVLKAYLNRFYRFHKNDKFEEIKMSLNVDQPSTGYQLGRLFATLERVQETANPGLNSTIGEKYYGSACTSPGSVFPTLLRLKNHHLAKIGNRGTVIWYEKKLGEIMEHVESFPAQNSLHEQGMFAIGYYHQRQDFYKKKDTVEESNEELDEIVSD